MKSDQVVEQDKLTGKGVTVAVIDSGFDYPEYDLAYWHDFTEEKSAQPIDPMGHGTHVVGDAVQMAQVMWAAGHGWVSLELDGLIFLTDAGTSLAKESRRRHEIVVAFLRALGVSDAIAQIDLDKE